MEAPAEDREAGLEVMEAASVEAREDTGVLMKTAGVHSEAREEDDTEARLEDREAMEVGKEAREVGKEAREVGKEVTEVGKEVIEVGKEVREVGKEAREGGKEAASSATLAGEASAGLERSCAVV